MCSECPVFLQALWKALSTLAKYSMAFDVSFLNVLPWWQSVFRVTLRAGQATALHRTSPRMSSASEPVASAEVESQSGQQTSREDEQDGGSESSCDNASSMSTATMDSSTALSSSTHKTSELHLQVTTDTDSVRLAARFRANMLLPVHDFCAALLRSTAWWFEHPHCTILCALFHMYWDGNSTSGQCHTHHSPEADLLCNLFCRTSCLLRVMMPLADGRQDISKQEIHVPGAPPAGGCKVGFGRSGQSTASMELNSADMDSLSWLEAQCPALAGVSAATRKDPELFFCKRHQGLLVEQLPAPFANLRAVHRLLLAVALWPSEARATLAWFSESTAANSLGRSDHICNGAPDTFMHLDAAARLSSALQCMDEYRPVLLHASTVQPLLGLLERAISVNTRGMLGRSDLVASDTLDALCNSPGASAPRQARPQLQVVDVSANTNATTCSVVIAEAASRGRWVLLSCAHLRPDVCDACVAAADELNRSDALSPQFKLFLSCPTAELWRIHVRHRLVTVNFGLDRFARPAALHLLRAVDTPAGFQVGLFDEHGGVQHHSSSAGAGAAPAGAPQATAVRMPAHHRLALQQWVLRVTEVLAGVIERTSSVASCGMLTCSRLPACSDRAYIHLLHVLKSIIRRTDATMTRAVRPADLQAAILQVRNMGAAVDARLGLA